MSVRRSFHYRTALLGTVALPVLAAMQFGACGGSVDGAGALSTATSGGPATTAGVGGDNTGGQNVGGSLSGSGGSLSGSGGAGGAPGCVTDADCAKDPKGDVCNTDTGDCVGCLPSNDTCPVGKYCNPSTEQCEVGCTDDSDCNPANNLLCNPQTHKCVGCVEDTSCPLGSICIASTCVPGCNDSHPCQPGSSCCGNTCYDLSNDEEHCGDCNTVCEQPPNADPICENGTCGSGLCIGVWKDCNGVAEDGCEQNTLQEGDCACTPGETKACYLGAPGTENVGPCKSGTTTCNADGLGWGPCDGQVIPVSEICANSIDEDCDGILDNATDYDGDGWSSCNGDCCDTLAECGSPKLVNPGAFEFIGDGVDNDCDPTSDDMVAPPPCSAGSKFTDVTGDDVAMAMDLCQFTAPAPPLPQKKWGVISVQQLLSNGNAPGATALANMQDFQTAIMTEYGTGGVFPSKGATMAGISSGRMRDQADAGYVNPNGGTGFGSSSQPPAAYLAAHGGSLPASAGCSGNCPAGSGANDSVNLKFTIRTPTNAQSFSYKFRFFSAEYWTYSCSSFNDFYLALLQTGAQGIPMDKNVSFDGLGNPVSVNNGFFDICVPKGCYTCPQGSGALAGTGMQLSNTGGATVWLTTDAPIVPGETMILELMLFDVQDSILDSNVLLDSFVWNASPASVGTHE